MNTTLRTRETEETGLGEDRASVTDIQSALRLILESQPFRTSKQCQDLLRYVVNHSIKGDDAALRERVIGAEVFSREPSYDTNDDPVVRVRAADVRKRLAQYYQSLEPGSCPLHIELQPGSYRVHFRPTQPAPGAEASSASEAADAPRPSSLKSIVWPASTRSRVAAVLLILLAIAGTARWVQSLPSPLESFWAPLTTAKQPLLIYLGANAAYVFNSDFLDKYRATHSMANNGPEFFVELPPDSTLHIGDLVAVKDTFVTTADVTAIVQLTTQLWDWKKPFVLRSGSDLSFGDLRNRPSVMIGGFNNPWTLELTNDLPYRFREGTRIVSRDHPTQFWSVPEKKDENSSADDYALISRLLTSKTGGPVITVSGIGQSGTQAAAEFLTNPDRMRDLLKSAPKGWEGKNIQVVLHVKVVGYQPVAVDVIATSYW